MSAVEPVRDATAFATEWSAFTDRAENATVFQSAPWMSVWLDRAATVCRLFAVRGEGLLGVVGVASRGGVRGAVGRLAETGDEALDGIYVEYNDFLVARDAPPDARRRAVGALLPALGAPSLVLRNVTPPLRQAAWSAGREAGWVVRVVTEQPCFATDLDAPSTISRNTRQQVARARRLYEERGALELSIERTPKARRAALPTLLRLHEGVWRDRGERGAFTPAVLGFHEALIARDDSPSEVLTLTAGDEPIGALLNLRHGGTVHNYQSGFETVTDNRLKPGLLTHLTAMEHYRREGLSAYDMMAGEARYKRSLGRSTKCLSVLELSKPGLRHRLRGVARNIRR